MTNVNADSVSQVENGGNEPAPPNGPPPPTFHGGNKVYKSGPLFLSSKGIGWTSWKKRWFILTRTSLVFFRSDPNVPQRGNEVNLTLGGIDLNSSGSVVVKEDKKLLTVLFPDGREGRAFTLKAETLEDLHEWKSALEDALSNAPSAAPVVGQNGEIKNDQSNASDAYSEQSNDRQLVKSMVIGRPILLALEDIDGTPSFLEKALRFIEENGVKTEGILRQAADVDDVEHRIREFEKGKVEFLPGEDPHVIADCVKYIIRELPSSPVPASCCKALLEACRTERGMRVSAMRSAICETFPEPNRRLLQRILMMMQTIASHKSVNRMSTSAVAACMAPLLLRPLLAGDCELENDFNVGGDGSVQLMQAAAAANHAQAIVITLLEEYENIFGEGSGSPEPYTDSEESGSESEEMTDDDDDDGDDDSFDDEDATEDSVSGVDAELIETSSDSGEDDSPEKAKKNLSTRSNDLRPEEEAEIQKLESTIAYLQKNIANEAKENSILQDSLETRKQDLHELRLALEKDVAGLQMQLQKEIELRAALEAGLGISEKPVSVSSIVNPKIKADLEEIERAEKTVFNLKNKAADLQRKLNQQREQNSRIDTTTSKKSTSSIEGAIAVSKLTKRLNFLKERRSQIANELQNQVRNSSQPVQNHENKNKLQESKGQSIEKNRESDNNKIVHKPDDQLPQNVDKGKNMEERSERFPIVGKGRSKSPPRTYSR